MIYQLPPPVEDTYIGFEANVKSGYAPLIILTVAIWCKAVRNKNSGQVFYVHAIAVGASKCGLSRQHISNIHGRRNNRIDRRYIINVLAGRPGKRNVFTTRLAFNGHRESIDVGAIRSRIELGSWVYVYHKYIRSNATRLYSRRGGINNSKPVPIMTRCRHGRA